MDKLPISVIIAAKNAERTIEKCLDSVRRNNPAEVIMVDGNSTDGTLGIVRKYTEKIYYDEGRGLGYAHQLGAEVAAQEHIVLVDADIILPPGTLSTLLAELKASDYVSMTARIVAANLSTYWERAIDWNVRLLQARRGGGLFATVLKRETILKYKLDAGIKAGGDDTDFQMRIEKQGYKQGMSSSLVYHQHQSDLRGLVKVRFKYGRAAPFFIRRYGPWHIGFWPPLTRLYWLVICLVKRKPQFIPYFIVDGIAQTAGMVKGFFELIDEALKRRRRKDAG